MNPLFPEPGTLLAERYRVLRPIGRGGMGVVLEAEHAVTQRRVAIKLMRPEWGDQRDAYERLVREATAAARIQHVNVVDVYDVIWDGTAVFLVMELLVGETLRDYFRLGLRPPHAVVGLLLAAMRGVAEAHRRGVIHRDIHPANIFLARQGDDPEPVPKVLDFGIAKIVGPDQEVLTRSRVCMGTPQYASYEQLLNARDVDERTDVYAFGAMLYEGLTGQTPFAGDSFIEVAHKIVEGEPTHPKRLRPALPEPLAELVMWAIAREREHRIESLVSLMRALEPFADAEAFREQTSDAGRALLKAAGRANTRARRAKRARRPASPTLLATGATCVALVGVVAWLWQAQPVVTATPATRPAVGATVLSAPVRAIEAREPAVEVVNVDLWPAASVPAAPGQPEPVSLPPEPPAPPEPGLPPVPPEPPAAPHSSEPPLERCSAPRFEVPQIGRRGRPVRVEACELDAGGAGRPGRCGRAS